MITISREAATDLNMTLEDMVEYWCRECMENGELVSGQTAWKLVSAYAQAKEAQFAGEVE